MMDFGMPQLDPSIGQPMAQPLQMPAPKKKGGMFGAGKGDKIAEAISAAIGGWLMGGGNPAGANILGMLQQRRAARDEQAQYGQRREDDFQDWVRKQAYQAANPSPVNNDTVADYDFIANQLGPDAAKEFLRNKTIAPPMMVPGPNGQMFMVPRSMPQQGAPAGVTFTPIDDGGPTPPASGGFPRSY